MNPKHSDTITPPDNWVSTRTSEPEPGVEVTVLVCWHDANGNLHHAYTTSHVGQDENGRAAWIVEPQYLGWDVPLWTRLRKNEPMPPLPEAW